MPCFTILLSFSFITYILCLNNLLLHIAHSKLYINGIKLQVLFCDFCFWLNMFLSVTHVDIFNCSFLLKAELCNLFIQSTFTRNFCLFSFFFVCVCLQCFKHSCINLLRRSCNSFSQGIFLRVTLLGHL